jgi:hypothetical protein
MMILKLGLPAGREPELRRVRFRFPAMQDLSLLHSVQTATGAHPASYPVGTEGVKLPEREADHSPPSSAQVKNGGTIPPLPHTSFVTLMVYCNGRDI